MNDPHLPPGPSPVGDDPIYGWTDLSYLLSKNGVSWRYYEKSGTGLVDPEETPTPYIWNPLHYFTTVRNDGQVGNIVDSSEFFDDAANGELPAVSWVAPDQHDSEHPPSLISNGQEWVTRLVNAVMQGPDWSSTAIFVAWDDWGGFYDHVVPPVVDANGYGLHVPGLLISPYAKKGLIDSQTLSFDAYLKFIEDDFLGGQRIDTTDGRPDPRPDVRENAPILGNLLNEFDFNQTPLPPMILPLRPVNPTADAGGPYSIQEGQSLTLDASASFDTQGLPLTFKWDVNGDGFFGDATGINPTLSWSRLQALGITASGSPFSIQVRALDPNGRIDTSVAVTLTVTPAPTLVTLSGSSSLTEGTSYTLTLTPGPTTVPDGYTIQWGDGSQNNISGHPAFVTHVFQQVGAYVVSARVLVGGQTFAAANTLSVTVHDALLAGSGRDLSTTENTRFVGLIASFQDANPYGQLGDFAATITWGDGQTSTGALNTTSGGFTISGQNSYAEEGRYSIVITIRDRGGASTLVVSRIEVADAPLVPAPLSIGLVEGTAFSGVVAAFRDPGGDGTINGYSATIDWGDGHTSAGTVASDGHGGFSVFGVTTYTQAGTYTVHVAVADNGGSRVSVPSTLVVTDASLQALGQLFTAPPGAAMADALLAVFTDAGGIGP
jgi:hypothetical protein